MAEELNPLTQQPDYKKIAQKYNAPILDIDYSKLDEEGYQPSSTIEPIGQYFPEELSQYDKNIPLSRISDINVYRGEMQPWYDQAGAFLNQAIIGEIIGGTIMSAGAIVGIPEIISNYIDKGEFDFSNDLFDAGKKISDWTQEVTPIYQTGGRFGDSGWWFQNGVSVASTISMLVPGMAVAKSVGWLGKIIKLGTTATKLTATGLSALTMRHAENFREANDVFTTTYQELINKGVPEEDARKAASEGASYTYGANYSNLAFDLIQMGTILRPFSGLTRNIAPITGKLAKAADEVLSTAKYTPQSMLGRIGSRLINPAKAGAVELTEGIEEVINTISSYEGSRLARIQGGIEEPDGSTFNDRLGDYFGKAELWDSFIWGALGGIAFKGTAHALGFDENKVINKNKIAEITKRSEIIKGFGENLQALENKAILKNDKGETLADYSNLNDTELEATRESLIKNMTASLGLSAAKAGNIDLLLEQFQDPKTIEALEQAGVASKEDIKQRLPEIIKEIEDVERAYKKNYKKLYEFNIEEGYKNMIASDLAGLEVNISRNLSKIKELENSVPSLIEKDTWYQAKIKENDKLSQSEQQENLDNVIEGISLRLAIQGVTQEYNKAKSNKSTDKGTIQDLEILITRLTKRASSIKPVSMPIDYTDVINNLNTDILNSISEKIALEEMVRIQNSNLEKASTKESINKTYKETKKITKEFAKVIEKSVAAASREKASKKKSDLEQQADDLIKDETVATEASDFDDTINPPKDTGKKPDVEEITSQPPKEAPKAEAPKEAFTKPEVPTKEEIEEARSSQKATELSPKEKVDKLYEAKKADIEKRRQEELKGKQFISVNDFDLKKGDVLYNLYSKTEEVANEYTVKAFSVGGEGMDQYLKGVLLIDNKTKKERWWNSSDRFTWNDLFKKVDTKEINAKYDAELAELNKQFDSYNTEDAATKTGTGVNDFKDGYNSEIPENTVIPSDNTLSSEGFKLKRLIGTAINYLVATYKTVRGNRSKSTIDFESVNQEALLASEWGTFREGDKVVLTVDAGFNDKVDVYTVDGENRPTRILENDGSYRKEIRSFQEIFQNDRINIPIKIQVERDGKLVTVGYLPTINWLSAVDDNRDYENLANTDTNPAELEIQKVREIREKMLSGDLSTSYNFKISKKGLGMLMSEKDKDGSKVRLPIAERLPSLLNDPRFVGTIAPFAIFNKEFQIRPKTPFGGNVAINKETLERLNESGVGALFMMIPSANAGTFIPVPVNMVDIPSNVSTMLVDLLDSFLFDSNMEFAKTVGNEYGKTINSTKDIKALFENFVYFYPYDEVIKINGNGITRLAFDINKSEIVINRGNGKAPVRILLNTKDSNPQVLEMRLEDLRNALTTTRLSVKLANINGIDTFSVPVVAEDRSISFEEKSYNEFLADNITTDIRELITKNDNPVYTIQPVIEITEDTKTTPQPPTDKKTSDYNQDYFDDTEGLPDEDEAELASVSGNIKPGVSERSLEDRIKEDAGSFLVKDGDYVYSSEKQRQIVRTISAAVYELMIDSDNAGKELKVNESFNLAKTKFENTLDNINKLLEKSETDALEDINRKGSPVKWVKSIENAKVIKEELERILKESVWNQFKNFSIINLSSLGISVKEDKATDTGSENTDEISDNLNEEEVEANEGFINKSFNDMATFQMDPKDTATWRVKIALSKIRSGKRNFLGFAEYLPFDTVFDDLLSIFNNVDGDIDTYIQTLKDIVKDNKSKWYINDVIRLLENTDNTWALKNNFVSVMQKAHNDFYLIKWKRESGGWTLNLIESNRNNVINKIVESWNENFKTSSIVKNIGGELKIDSKSASKFKEELIKLNEDFTNKKISKEVLVEKYKLFTRDLFNTIGIDIPEAVYDYLFTKNLYNKTWNIKGTFDQQFRFKKDGTPDGLVSFIVNSLTTEIDATADKTGVDSFSLNNPFIGEHSEKAVKYLANLSSKYGLKVDASTHRNVESKIIYDYSFFTPERLRVAQLNATSKNPDGKSLVRMLKDTPFASFSAYADLIEQGEILEYGFVDGLSEIGSTAKGVTRSNMSDREQMISILAYFQHNLNKPTFVGLTHSDKAVTPLVSIKKIDLGLNLPDGIDVIDSNTLYNIKGIRDNIKRLVLTEVSRIKSSLNNKEDNPDTYTKDSVGNQYYEGAEYFYFFPQLNDLVRINGNIDRASLDNTEILVRKALEDVANTINLTVESFYNMEIISERRDNKGKGKGLFDTSFNKYYLKNLIGKELFTLSEKEGFTAPEAKRIALQAAIDLEVSYVIHNANMMMLVHGDPATEFRGDVETTLTEYQKRLAKDVAPGALGHYNWKLQSKSHDGVIYGNNRKYSVVYAKDITNSTETEGYLKSTGLYDSLDRTDAQEWTTVEEHLNVLMSYGRISDSMYVKIMDKIVSSRNDGTHYYELSDEELEVVLQPMKPVQVISSINNFGVEETTYIKSSSYPLLPSFTRGLDIDKIRVAMESSKIPVNRIPFKTATKVGYKNLTTLSDKDGNILDNIEFNDSNINHLDRQAFTIQQDIPYEKGKHRITTITQMNKLLFEGLEDFEFDSKEFGKFSGTGLRGKKELLRTRLMQLSANELYKRMGIVLEDNTIPVIVDKTKLLNAVKDEAIRRNWSINDVESLGINNEGNFLIPLSFNNSAERVESLILSLFTNTIIKQKINGKSLVQGTSSGFKNNVKTLEEVSKESGIVFVKDKFDTSKGLTYITIDSNKNVKKAQVLVPWKFAGNLSDYIGEDGYLDLDLVDEELLTIIGARIPNQGHSSQVVIEIVGFIPDNLGDLIIVPGEITKQMGSDFDVDKLYTYIYNNVETESGRIVKVPNLLKDDFTLDKDKYNKFIEKILPGVTKQVGERTIIDYKKFNDRKKELKFVVDISQEDVTDILPVRNVLYRASLENSYIGIHETVLSHPDVIKKSLIPLDKADLTITGKVNKLEESTSNFLSAFRQLKDYSKQKAGKDGVGVMSRAVVGLTVLQPYDIRLAASTKEGIIDSPFKGFKDDNGNILNLLYFSGTGKSYFNGNASKENLRSKIDNIIIQQSGAVDNTKTPVLSMNNFNMTTFNASIVISALSDSKNNGKSLDLTYNSYFLRQEIIRDFVNEMSNISDTINQDFVSDRKEEVIERLIDKYLTRAGLGSYNTKGTAFSRKDLKDLLNNNGSSDVTYVKNQIEILEHFNTLDTIGKELSEIFGAISVDSKGLGKNFWESSHKQEQMENLSKKSYIFGASEIMTKSSEFGTIKDYTRQANFVMGQLFPYTKSGFTNIVDNLEAISGKDEKVDVEFRKLIWEELKRFLVTDSNLDIYINREALYGEDSFAKEVEAFKLSDAGKTNLFIQKLKVVKATKKGNPDIITYAASFAERLDEADVIKSFIDLFISTDPSVRAFAKKLVQYAYSNGGIQKALEYVKYIPVAYLKNTNFTKVINSHLNTLEDSLNFKDNSEKFIEQFLQHHPKYAKKLSDKSSFTPQEVIVDEEDDIYLKTQTRKIIEFSPYIVRRDNTNNAWALYKRTESFVKNNSDKIRYTRIPLLGGKGKDLISFNEYSLDNEGIKYSIINENNAAVFTKTDKSSENVVDKKVTPPNDPLNKSIPNSIKEEQDVANLINPSLVGKPALEHLRDRFTTERFKNLLDFFIEMDQTIPVELKFKIDNNLKSKKTGGRIRGKWIGGDIQTIFINPKEIKEFNDIKGKKTTIQDIEQVMVHELVHAFTLDLYNRYKAGEKLPNGIADSFRKLETLYTLSKKRLTKEQSVELNKFLDALDNSRMEKLYPDVKERVEKFPMYYGFVSVTEFLSEALSNPEFQGILDSIQVNDKDLSKDYSLWDRFLELVKKIFNGIGITKGSILESTLSETINLISTFDGSLRNPYLLFAEDEINTTENVNDVPVLSDTSNNNEGTITSTVDDKTITFNKGQQEAYNKITDWLNNSKESSTTLKGRAGTGKTTIIKQIVNNLPEEQVLYLAPTHKAKTVLSKSTGKPAFTIESALFIDLDETTGEFTPNLYKRNMFLMPIKSRKYIIIDEASMIKDNLLEELFDNISSDQKIIFMGDSNQLPPVKQDNDSSVFNNIIAELTEIVRQSEDSPILKIASKIADNIENGTKELNVVNEQDAKFNSKTNSGAILLNNSRNLLQMWINDFKANPTSTKIVTFNNQNHSNKQSVKNINKVVREMMFGENPNFIYKGEQLMAYDSFFEGENQLINNSEDYTVEDFTPVVNKSQTITAFSKKLGNRSITIEGLSGVNAVLRNNITGEMVIETIFLPDPKSIEIINKHKQEQFNKKDIQMGVLIGKAFSNLYYGYAITSHKSQGSTYRNSYVLLDNILYSDSIRKNKAKNQSLYVAISRASDKVVIHSNKFKEDGSNFIDIEYSQKSHLNTIYKKEVTSGMSEDVRLGEDTKVIESLLPGPNTFNSLGMSVKEFMNKELTKTEREILRNMINTNQIKFKCI